MIPALFIYKIKDVMGTFLLLLFFFSFFLFFSETLWNQSVAEYENKTSRRESKYSSEIFTTLPVVYSGCMSKSAQRLYVQDIREMNSVGGR